jgi:hypothetical protein
MTKRKYKYPKNKDIDTISRLILLSIIYVIYNGYKNYDKVIIYLKYFLPPILSVIILLIILYYYKKKKIEENRFKNTDLSIVNIYNIIKEFKPLRNYIEEKLYQTELA